jgi:hypothetical protein
VPAWIAAEGRRRVRAAEREAKGMFWNLRWVITLVIVIAAMAVAIYGRPD